MKRNISDLLDSYPADLDLDLATPLSSRRIEELTMDKINVTGKRRRTPGRVLAVAALAAALCGTALAGGYHLGAGDWLRSVFEPQSGELSQSQLELLNEMGETFAAEDGTVPAAVTSNGATITPVAALADENIYYIRLRVEAPEGTVLPDLDGETEGYYQFSGMSKEEQITLEWDEGIYETGGWCMGTDWLPDADPTDNVKEAVLDISRTNNSDLRFNDGLPKQLHIRGLWIQSPGKDYVPVFAGDFVFEIGDIGSQEITLDCGDGLTWEGDALGGYTNTLKSLTLSPLSMTYIYTTTLEENDVLGPAPGPIEIVMKDGGIFYSDYRAYVALAEDVADRQVRWDGPAYGETVGELTFQEPLALDQVDYVQYGDHRLYVE